MSFLVVLTTQLANLIEPLSAVGSTDAGERHTQALLERLGLTPTAITGEWDQIASDVKTLRDAIADPDFDDTAALTSLRTIFGFQAQIESAIERSTVDDAPQTATNEIVGMLAADFLSEHAGWLFELLAYLKVLDPLQVPAGDRSRPLQSMRLRPDRVVELLSDPASWLSGLQSPFDTLDAVDMAMATGAQLLRALAPDGGVRIESGTGGESSIEASIPMPRDISGPVPVALRVASLDTPDRTISLELEPPDVEQELRVGSGWSIELASIAEGGVLSASWSETSGLNLDASIESIMLRAALRGSWEPAAELLRSDLATLSLAGAEFEFVVDLSDNEVTLSGALSGVRLALTMADAIPVDVDEIVIELRANAKWSSLTGLNGGLMAALSFNAPLGVQIGPLGLTSGHLQAAGEVGADEVSISLQTGVGLALKLGPVLLSAAPLGARFLVTIPSSGPSAISAEAWLPNLISVEVDSGAVAGSGFLFIDQDNHRYSGAFDLSIYEIRVAALGVLQTHLPTPGPQFSLLLVLNAQFPGLQLGFGLTLNGITGLLALHRTSDPDALRSSLASGAIGQLLTLDGAADDPIAFLTTLDTLFPVRAGRHVVGIGVQLRWIVVVRFDVMVAIELPGPARILILGSARAELAVGDADLLRLRLDVLGIVDFERRELSIDAALVDSSLLDIFDIQGGVAVRMSWGSQPYVVMSVGGFHPDFVPEPTILPIPVRVGISSGQPGDLIYFRLDGYFAVTTNTVQFGAHAELRINAGPLRALGALGFDALIQFDPFWFIFNFRARFSISIAGISLAGASINGSLSGPGPMVFRGRVCIEILFFDICWSGTIETGRSIDQPARTVGSVVGELRSEITAQNVTSTPQSNAPVLVELTTDASDRPIVAPDGTLAWAQTKAPLGMPLELFEGVPLVEPVIVEPSDEPRLIEEWFAPASFATYSDSEAINLPAFERMPGGFEIPATGTLHGIVGLPLPVTAEEIVLPDLTPVLIVVDVWPLWFATEPAEPAPLLAVHNEVWVLETDTGVLIDRGSAAVIGQHARLRDLVATPEGDEVTVEGL